MTIIWDQIHEISKSIESISHGDANGATGLEGLTMVIGNKPGDLTVVDGLYAIALSIQELAAAIRNK